jgi:very-short-patch-repair endonuclease
MIELTKAQRRRLRRKTRQRKKTLEKLSAKRSRIALARPRKAAYLKKERVGFSTWKERSADRMRNKPTKLERILETSIRLVIGQKYCLYRQWLQSGYILDFYIRELKMCLEADGPFHDADYDRRRDGHMLKRGIITIRFNQYDLEHDLGHVDTVIRREIQDRLSSKP